MNCTCISNNITAKSPTCNTMNYCSKTLLHFCCAQKRQSWNKKDIQKQTCPPLRVLLDWDYQRCQYQGFRGTNFVPAEFFKLNAWKLKSGQSQIVSEFLDKFHSSRIFRTQCLKSEIWSVSNYFRISGQISLQQIFSNSMLENWN